MDDTSGWDAVLVEGWGPLVRAAVCDRVQDAMTGARGLLAVCVTTPDDAPPAAIERVHDAVIAAIAVETGAHLDDLGSQSAWATYDDVWAELGRRWVDGGGLQAVPSHAEAGALLDARDTPTLPRLDGSARLDLAGLFRWLATDEGADEDVRDRARDLVLLIRGR